MERATALPEAGGEPSAPSFPSPDAPEGRPLTPISEEDDEDLASVHAAELLLASLFMTDSDGSRSKEFDEAISVLYGFEEERNDYRNEDQEWLHTAMCLYSSSANLPHYLSEDLSQYAHYMLAGCSVTQYGRNYLDSGYEGVELYLSHELSKVCYSADLLPGQHLSCETYLAPNKGAACGRKAVVTEENLLTQDELRQHKAEVDAAILE